MASPENTDHNLVVLWLGGILNLVVGRKRLGRVTINKVAYRLSERTAPEPDLAFVRADRLDLVRRGYVDGAPDLAVEFVSPESVERDYEDKRRLYEEAGVQEYWIIDLDESRATFLVRRGDRFVEAPLKGSVFHSSVVPGFVLDTTWLWQNPLPDMLLIVQEILAGPANA
jgi:Uma2 family endonuclease